MGGEAMKVCQVIITIVTAVAEVIEILASDQDE